MSVADEWQPPDDLKARFWQRRFEDEQRKRVSAERWIYIIGAMGASASIGACIRQDVIGLERHVASVRDSWIEFGTWQSTCQYVGLAIVLGLFGWLGWRVK